MDNHLSQVTDNEHQYPTRRENNLIIREATKADLDGIAKVAQAAFPDDPEFNYRFPYRFDFPEDNWNWTKREYEGYLDQPQKFTVLVVTARVEQEGKATCDVPVALAVWDMAVLTESTSGGINGGINERRDANPTHMKAFVDALGQGFNKYFGPYGKDQVHLWLLATHPDFRRRGAGTMLCNWGKERAMERGHTLTVLASSMGKILYGAVGYNVLGSVIVQADEEEERFEVFCMEQKLS